MAFKLHFHGKGIMEAHRMKGLSMSVWRLCLITILSCALALFGLTACGQEDDTEDSSLETLTLNIQCNESLTVTLDSSSGLNLLQQGVNFIVTRGDDTVARGTLQSEATFEEFKTNFQDSKTYEEQTINDYQVCVVHEDDIYEALISVPDASTHIRLVGYNGSDTMQEVLKALQITKAS